MRQVGTDRRIEKKKWTLNKVIYLAGSVILLVLLFFGFKSFNKKIYKVDRNRLTIKEVVEGEFQDMILIDGDVEPIDLVLVNTLEGGSVDDIYVEDGIFVEKGTPLLKLSNPSVTLGYMNQETAIVEQINNLRNLKLALEKDQRNLDESLIDSENALEETKRRYKTDSVLYTKDVIAKNDYVDIRESYRYQQQKRNLLSNNVRKSSRDNQIQIQQINRSIQMMQRNLEMIHENMEKMLVKAPVSGMLSSFDPIIGENFTRNQTVAKIDVQSGFKIKGQVDEYYLSRVKPGQLARFSLDGEIIDLKVKKVLPEVINRRFEIELVFVSDAPESVTLGQSLQVRLDLSKAQKSLMIPRGNYFQSSGGQYVFVLNGEGEAHKRFIKLGNRNPSYYQVLEGLEEGEQFITSSYDDYKNYETILIN